MIEINGNKSVSILNVKRTHIYLTDKESEFKYFLKSSYMIYLGGISKNF